MKARLQQEITRRKHTKNALQEHAQQFRTIIEQATEKVALIDEDGNLIEWNLANERMTGLKRAEVIGKPFWNVIIQLAVPERRTPQRHKFMRAAVFDAPPTGQSDLFKAPLEVEFYPLSGTAPRYVCQTIFHIKDHIKEIDKNNDLIEKVERVRENFWLFREVCGRTTRREIIKKQASMLTGKTLLAYRRSWSSTTMPEEPIFFRKRCVIFWSHCE